jgi:glucuronoarabinoxylan endo-1,4-beta-xylanase
MTKDGGYETRVWQLSRASVILIALALAALAAGCETDGLRQKITVNWSSPQQTIDGFGGSVADFTSPLTNQLADFFFTTSGIGLSIVRTQIIPDLADCQAWMVSSGAPASDCVTVPAGATSLVGEPLAAQQAAARGVTTFIASCWSPPASMKSNGVFHKGGNFIGNPTNYTWYAEALASYPAFMAGYGISISAISPQNEPDISQTYPSALWTAQQFHDFIPYLDVAIRSSGYSPRIMFPENSAWSRDYAGFAATTMTDRSVAPDVGLLAQHGYVAGSKIAAPADYGRHVWIIEDSSQSATYDGSMADALSWAQKIYNYLALAKVNAFVWWFLSDMPGNGDGTDNSALTDIKGNIPLRAYITGNWSKFVRPGWVEVSVTNTGSLLVTAFKSADSSKSAVVIVNNGPSVSNQVFNVGTQMGTNVIPWITSAARSLEAEGSIPVTGGSITYTIPAGSVVTFAGPA